MKEQKMIEYYRKQMKTAIGYYRKINTEWNKNADQKVNDKKEKIRIRTEKEKTRKPCAL